ncbi:hypothetical protein THMIRHAM_11430 [Thiomicrorhabdus immobilis]|uniref:DUF2232 domain-containing protein n=1 Tax=Thiomicrorhabdus immobilis TaxID=2791037 RepID=A0ABN6CWB4_9GAMM|nr:hypothetical protein [Thiomicrorhabdus immobilis]BCN93358.1 hypothetical protein THMIRHAM_11430 [Thiomicrorhabdus immobilis]
MLGIANYSMKGPMQAIIAVVLFSALSVFLAPFGILVGAIIALVTLRISVTEGFKTLIWGVVSNVALTILISGNYFPAMISIIEYMLPIWLLAVVLRQTNSLALALQLAMVITGLSVVLFHMAVPNPVDWWVALFNQYVAPLFEASQIPFDAKLIPNLAEMVTMLIAIFMIILWFSILIIARWWQSELYNPGQFKIDFYQISLPKSTAYTAIVLAILGLVSGAEAGLVYDLSGIIIAGLMFQGIAIAHHTVATKELNKAWLVGLYILLFLFPQAMLILATIGLVDTWVDFRNRWENEEL